MAASKWSGEKECRTREQQIATAFSEDTQNDLFLINMYKYMVNTSVYVCIVCMCAHIIHLHIEDAAQEQSSSSAGIYI